MIDTWQQVGCSNHCSRVPSHSVELAKRLENWETDFCWILIPGSFSGIWQAHSQIYVKIRRFTYTGWRTKCHTIDCTQNTFLLIQKCLTSGTELILIGWKIFPNEEHVQCYHRFASQPLANEPLHSSQLFDTSRQKVRGTTSLCGPWAALHFVATSGTLPLSRIPIKRNRVD